MFSIKVHDVDEKSHSRCGSLLLGNLNVSTPIKALNPSEFHVLNSLTLPIPETLFVKTLRLNPRDIFVFSQKGKTYKKRIRSLNAFSKKVKEKDHEFLLIPHLSKKSFKGIEKQDASTIDTLINLQMDGGSSAIVIPDYWKYTSNEYQKYVKWWIKKVEQYEKPILATLLPSEKESRVKKRLEVLSEVIDGILVNMQGDLNHAKFATTFDLLLKIRKSMEKLWIHGYETPHKISDMLCAEQTVLPLIGSDSISAKEPKRLTPKLREQLLTKKITPRMFDIATNGVLNKDEYKQHHHTWECPMHHFCKEETLDTIYEKSEKLRGHSILDQMILIGNFFDWVKEKSIIDEMKQKVFSKQFIERNLLLEGGLRRWLA